MTAHRPLNLGHRGASSLAPENTLAAFRLAREIGADGIEFDVQLSQDGVPVIMHDDRLERTSNGHGRVDETVWSVLRRLDAGRWFDVRFAGEAIPILPKAGETTPTFKREAIAIRSALAADVADRKSVV